MDDLRQENRFNIPQTTFRRQKLSAILDSYASLLGLQEKLPKVVSHCSKDTCCSFEQSIGLLNVLFSNSFNLLFMFLNMEDVAQEVKHGDGTGLQCNLAEESAQQELSGVMKGRATLFEYCIYLYKKVDLNDDSICMFTHAQTGQMHIIFILHFYARQRRFCLWVYRDLFLYRTFNGHDY